MYEDKMGRVGLGGAVIFNLEFSSIKDKEMVPVPSTRSDYPHSFPCFSDQNKKTHILHVFFWEPVEWKWK